LQWITVRCHDHAVHTRTNIHSNERQYDRKQPPPYAKQPGLRPSPKRRVVRNHTSFLFSDVTTRAVNLLHTSNFLRLLQTPTQPAEARNLHTQAVVRLQEALLKESEKDNIPFKGKSQIYKKPALPYVERDRVMNT
jgi:hypothetical protein